MSRNALSRNCRADTLTATRTFGSLADCQALFCLHAARRTRAPKLDNLPFSSASGINSTGETPNESTSGARSGEARLVYSTLKLTREEKRYERNWIALADLQEAQTEKQLAAMALANALDNQRVDGLKLERANVALSRNIIRSPVNGVVVDRFLRPVHSFQDNSKMIRPS